MPPTSSAARAAPPLDEVPPWSDKAPLFIVLNACSGHEETRERVQAVQQALQGCARPHELILIRRPQELEGAARHAVVLAQRRGGAVVAAGGDGTINAVVQHVAPAGLPLGVLPQGTFNYFGRSYGIPQDLHDAAKALLTSRPRPIQLGQVNDRLFLVNASIGLYPQVLEQREQFKQRMGRHRAVAMLAGLSTLLSRHRDWAARVWLDDREQVIVTPTLFVGNNALQLEQMGIAEAPALKEGQLVAIALRPASRLGMLGLVFKGARGRLGEAEKVDTAAFTHLEIAPALPGRSRRVKVATDGEVMWLESPLRFQPSPRPLHLLVPAAP